MNIKTQMLVAFVVILAIISLVNMIRNNKLELKYSLLWFALGIGILLFDCFPWLTTKLASFLGIGKPINLLFFAGFIFALLIIFSLTIVISKLSVRIKRLIQEMGILKKELENLQRKNSEK